MRPNEQSIFNTENGNRAKEIHALNIIRVDFDAMLTEFDKTLNLWTQHFLKSARPKAVTKPWTFEHSIFWRVPELRLWPNDETFNTSLSVECQNLGCKWIWFFLEYQRCKQKPQKTFYHIPSTIPCGSTNYVKQQSEETERENEVKRINENCKETICRRHIY